MSGPKLSKLELERRRREELERIQREITRLKTEGLLNIQRCREGTEWCREEQEKLKLHQEYLDSSALEVAERQQVGTAIRERLAKLEEILKECGRQQDTVKETELEQLKTETDRLAQVTGRYMSLRDDYQKSEAEYFNTLMVLRNALTEKLYEDYEEETQELTEDTGSQESDDEELEKEKADLRRRLRLVRTHPYADEKDEERAQKAIRRLDEISDWGELKNHNSIVVAELERSLRKRAELTEEYRQLLAKKNALALSLGSAEIEDPPIPRDNEELKRLIEMAGKTISEMEAELFARAEREEIARSVDEAMAEMGYDTIGEMISPVASRIKLFKYNDRSGLQITQKQDGTVQVLVVGIAEEEKKADVSVKNAVYQDQVEFCGKYDDLLEILAGKGVRVTDGTDDRKPAAASLVKVVNIHDYLQDEKLEQTEDKLTGKGTPPRPVVRRGKKPIVLADR